MNSEQLKNMNISTKIVIAMVLLFLASKSILTYFSVDEMKHLTTEQTKKSLNVVSDAIFLSLRNAMNTGDVTVIKDTEEQASKIKGVLNLNVEKSQPLIEMYGSEDKYTTDPDILRAFKTKQEILIDTVEKKTHFMRILKPMVASQECLMCHANQSEGDVIGVIDLAFALNSSDEMINSSSNFLLIVSLIVIILSSILIYLLTQSATKPLHFFQEGLEQFFKYVNKETTEIEQIQVFSHDEIGQMVESVNKNIVTTVENIKVDTIFIGEVKDLVTKMKEGHFDCEIKSEPNTPELKELKELINDVVNYVKTHVGSDINLIVAVLDKFAHHDYTPRVDDNGTVSSAINELGNIVSEMLLSSKRLGMILQQNSNLLTHNVETLTNSANQQAANLEQTAAQIEEITANLNNTSSKTISMTSLANEVKTSSDEGKNLALRSAQAMEEINNSTSSIKDAIEAIDQIAFQTNILSLNAAVEAATAGEAGKGFAVVAQEVRNLANRSAEAAKTIKDLVDQATEKAQEGKTASDTMINGYNKLNGKIDETITLIEDVASNSTDQISVINSLNDSMGHLDISTQENAKVANETNEIAVETNEVAENIVKQTDSQIFAGKDSIKIREKVFNEDYPENKNRRKKHAKLYDETNTALKKEPAPVKQTPKVTPKSTLPKQEKQVTQKQEPKATPTPSVKQEVVKSTNTPKKIDAPTKSVDVSSTQDSEEWEVF
jgi:methyl-accepting chemotaxis protein